MPWIRIVPTNRGGGRKPAPAGATLNAAGQMHITLAAAQMLGLPPRVLIDVEPEKQLMRFQPTTDDHEGAFSLSGGGNSPYRLHTVRIAKEFPQMVGRYRARKIMHGIEFYKI